MTIVIVDMCGTLFHENTTRGFVEHLHAKGTAHWQSRIALSRVLSWLESKSGSDLVRPLLIRSLRGISKERLYAEAREYVSALVHCRLREEVVGMVEERRAKGARVCLATASLDPIAAAANEHFAFNHILSSQLEFQRGVCTGRLSYDSRGRKWESFSKLFPEIAVADEIIAITDNPEDTDLRQRATEFHWVGE